MSKDLDIDDVAETNPEAKRQLTVMREAFSEMEKENARLRRALMDCDHQTGGMRVWGGMGWKYHSPHAERIHNIARSALDVAPNAELRGGEAVPLEC